MHFGTHQLAASLDCHEPRRTDARVSCLTGEIAKPWMLDRDKSTTLRHVHRYHPDGHMHVAPYVE